MRISSYVGLKYTTQILLTALATAGLEWLLMFMLFLDASFAYLVTKFARYCELQIPCLLCSRIDHVMGKEKKGFYWDLICVNHKLEISSRVVCRAHDKLVDVHEMCEDCLFSFATVNKSNAETCRLLVGKMGGDHPVAFDQPEDGKGVSGKRICSCCNEQWISKGYNRKELCRLSFGSGTESAEHEQSLSIEHRMDELRKASDESGTRYSFRTGKNGSGPLSHVEYSRVKITSDTESEIHSDDGSASELIRETDNLNGGLTAQCVRMDPSISVFADDVITERFMHQVSPSKVAVFESEMQLETNDHQGIGLGLEDLNWQQVDHKVDKSIPAELISFDEIPTSSVTMDNMCTPSELISFVEDPPSSVTKASFTISGESSKYDLFLY